MTLVMFLLLVELVCRASECILVSGDQVRVRDLTASFPALGHAKQDQVLFLTPVVGMKRWVSLYESKLRWENLGSPDPPQAAFCLERKSRSLTAASVLASLRRNFSQSNVEIELVDFSRFLVPEGEVEFPLTGLRASALTNPRVAVLWNGRVASGGGSFAPVWAKARMRVERRVTVARSPMPAGHIVGANDIAIASEETFPLAAVIENGDEVVGLAAKRSIPAGIRLTAGLFEAAPTVTNGQRVTVDVVNGSIRLQLFATAEASGRAGQTIWLRSGEGKRFRARIRGPQQAVLEIRENDSGDLPVDRTGHRHSVR